MRQSHDRVPVPCLACTLLYVEGDTYPAPIPYCPQALQLAGAVEPQEPAAEELPGAVSLPSVPADITLATAYTLEEEKQQAERDQQVCPTLPTKQAVRRL
jgi:hypothetical protein